MSTITSVEIECPCGELINGVSRGNGRAAERTALNTATKRLLDHVEGVDFTVWDFDQPGDRKKIVRGVIKIAARISK